MAKSSEVRINAEPGKAQFHQYLFATGLLSNLFFVGADIEIRNQSKAEKDMKELQLWGAL